MTHKKTAVYKKILAITLTAAFTVGSFSSVQAMNRFKKVTQKSLSFAWNSGKIAVGSILCLPLIACGATVIGGHVMEDISNTHPFYNTPPKPSNYKNHPLRTWLPIKVSPTNNKDVEKTTIKTKKMGIKGTLTATALAGLGIFCIRSGLKGLKN